MRSYLKNHGSGMSRFLAGPGFLVSLHSRSFKVLLFADLESQKWKTFLAILGNADVLSIDNPCCYH